MGSSHAEVVIARPVAEVWKVVADFGGIDAYFPGVESCRLEGDSRFIKMGQIEIREDLLAKDDSAHELVYGIGDGPVPVDKHRATIRVSPEGDGSKVTWDCEYAPDDLGALFEPTYQGAVAALKAHLEG